MKNKLATSNFKVILSLVLIFTIVMPINVRAIQTINSNDTKEEKQEKCNKYYSCIKKEIDKAKENNETLTSSNLQIECNAELVSTGGTDYDYCDNNRLFDGKNLKDLLEEAKVHDKNDAYQQNKQKCEDAKKKTIEKACSSCTKCMDNNQGKIDKCKNECMVGNPTACAGNQAESQKKINVLGSYCPYKYDPNNWDDEDENFYKPLAGGGYVCNGMLSETLRDELTKIYKTVSLIMVVAVVIFGMLDFFKAVSAGDADTQKKVTKKFTNRLIIVILIATLPVLLQLILTLFGNDSMKNCLEYFK